MMPPKRHTYTGVIKDEGAAIILKDDGGFSLVINMNGFNPHADRAALLPFVGKRVSIEGMVPPRSDELIVGSIADIKPLAAPKRKLGGPKP
ncbi:MAG: hypothetical protein ACAH80_07890 [Alphaproteobacteria bacterium]